MEPREKSDNESAVEIARAGSLSLFHSAAVFWTKNDVTKGTVDRWRSRREKEKKDDDRGLHCSSFHLVAALDRDGSGPKTRLSAGPCGC